MFKSFGFLAGQTFKLFGISNLLTFDLSGEGHSRNASMSMFFMKLLTCSIKNYAYIYIIT